MRQDSDFIIAVIEIPAPDDGSRAFIYNSESVCVLRQSHCFQDIFALVGHALRGQVVGVQGDGLYVTVLPLDLQLSFEHFRCV